ncbi:hypothetical protein AAFF_G00086450 [Aldrovandia affinis]|uniref:Uncharacterized protein n=1 Tax=Aldrovandia affinis TaxID=143900 RepID=A0AAD7WCN8_9TELE|nr:hypothetical protein AAFF_G00086450 [Aldrovandia affinis]
MCFGTENQAHLSGGSAFISVFQWSLTARLKSRHPYNKAAQEMLNFTSEDISRDAWLAAVEAGVGVGRALPSPYIWDPGDHDLPRRQFSDWGWKSSMKTWGFASVTLTI